MILRPRLAAAALLTLPLLLAGSAFAATGVSVAPFKSIQLRGGGHVILRHGAVQHVTLVKGSTQFTRFKIDGGELTIDICNENCPQHYDLEIEIVSPAIDGLAIQGGGEIESRGDFPKQGKIGAAVNGGGTIDIRAMSAEQVDAVVNGGGDIKTKPVRALHAAVNGGGEIAYWGNPEVALAVNGGGAVTKK